MGRFTAILFRLDGSPTGQPKKLRRSRISLKLKCRKDKCAVIQPSITADGIQESATLSRTKIQKPPLILAWTKLFSGSLADKTFINLQHCNCRCTVTDDRRCQSCSNSVESSADALSASCTVDIVYHRSFHDPTVRCLLLRLQFTISQNTPRIINPGSSSHPTTIQRRRIAMSYQNPMLQSIFNSVDTDRSGKISAEELQRALSNGTWNPFNPETCRLMTSMFDSDQDGAITFNEFYALWDYINQWTQSFRSFDADCSGNIDRTELSMALSKLGYRLNDWFIDLLMQKFDRTHTHRINFDDFIQLCIVLQMLTSAFREKDTDRDGIITIRYEEYLTMVFTSKIQL